MIAIENFKATTLVETNDGKYATVDCIVVGITRTDEGAFDFVVVTEEDDERWAAQREFVTAPDGKTYWPH
jgi:hypothetical protein